MDSSQKIRDRREQDSSSKSRKNFLDVDRLKLKRSPDSRTSCTIEASTPLESERTIPCCDHEIDLTPIIWKTPRGDRVVLRSIKQLDEDDVDEDSYRTATQSSIRIKTEINQNSSPINKNYVKVKNAQKKENLSVTLQNGRQQDKDRVEKSVAAGKKVARHQSFPSRIPVRIVSRTPLADKPVPNPNIRSSSNRPPIVPLKPIDVKKSNQYKLQSKRRSTNALKRCENPGVTSRLTSTIKSSMKSSRFQTTQTQIVHRPCDKQQRIEINKVKPVNQVKRLKSKRLTEPVSPKLLTAARAALRQQILQASDSGFASRTKSSLSLSERKSQAELLREALKNSDVVNFTSTKKMSKLNSY